MEQGNKIALITGASRGLGKNMALNLAQQGNDIIVIYRSKEQEALEVVKSIESLGRKSVAMQLDTANTKNFDTFFSDLQTVLETNWNRKTFDFLINNAGIDANSQFADTTEEDFDALMNVHFKGVYFLTQKALPYIADNGRIINLSTGLTRFVTPGYAAYASMKGAIEVLTKYLAKELGHRGITVNMVAPGIIHTDFTERAFAAHEGLEAHVNSITALGRVGEPQDIGAVVAFLCTDGARWINAQRIEASGGMNL
ncbi:SDR family NAD(P)-dependent oxidoreductase [Dyadobacter sp. CY347]|uniref:SDR family NAD(P)-dependent oxidoreductase n=1 Tax=Dyadobacter sp. CY347 TaxID=2909336 RepID=UPI001F1BCEFE|nr:SDR family oxidoreductase [Dyadobacter sp. CY347]MCF2490708.1 SDR family oxidoreductase [Dyadobacter sp. CY347]